MGDTLKIGGALSNLNKKELLRRIRKYEKLSGNKSKISMKNKKQVMIDYLEQNIQERRVTFESKPNIIEINARSDNERKERKKELKKIKKTKKEKKNIKNIYYKDIPTLDKYLEIKKYNLSSKKLKKREPIKFIKGIDSEDKKKIIYNQKKYKKHKIKYNIKKKKDKVVLKIYEKEREEKKEDIIKEYNFDKKQELDKYKAEYKAKVDLIKYVRKLLKKQ